MSKPLGPYSPVVRAGDFVIVSGQGGMPTARSSRGVRAETTQTMKNVAAQLATVGASLSDIVKTTCFLTDMENFAAFNEAYAEALGTHRPARSTVGVAGAARRTSSSRSKPGRTCRRGERAAPEQVGAAWALTGGPNIGDAYLDYHDQVWGVPARDRGCCSSS
jgi:2-iminobutanoate/2-iminopropanoate deaminase